MIVFPGRRTVGLKAATASSRVETVPMLVRNLPSRTRWTISPSCPRSDSTTKSIAAQLAISSKTVDNHRARIYEKLHVDSPALLATLVLKHCREPGLMIARGR